MSKKIVAFVPLKLNNERLPGKNTKSFDNGKPLLSYILSSLTCVEGIDEIYVYCSDEDVKKYLPEKVRFLQRSEKLDLTTTPIIDVLTSFSNNINADIYILAHATAPFIRPGTIRMALEAVSSEKYDSAFTVKKIQEFLWIGGESNYDTLRIPRTQDISDTYAETTGLYVFTKELIEKGRRIGDMPCLIPVDFVEAVDINNPIDFDFAQIIFDKYINVNQ